MAVAVGLLLCLGLTVVATPADAAVEWGAEIQHGPTKMAPGERAGILVDFRNEGDTPAPDWPTVTLELPSGVTFAETDVANGWSCAGTSTVTCGNPFGAVVGVRPFSYPPDWLKIVVDVAPGAPEGTAPVSITLDGAGAASPTALQHELTISAEAAQFGAADGGFEARALDESGDDHTQAGGHPHVATTYFQMNTKFNDPADNPGNVNAWAEFVEPVAPLKDVVVDLPAGFVGDPTAGPTCANIDEIRFANCPHDSQVGKVTFIQLPLRSQQMAAVYNMVPAEDAPAQLAFSTPAGIVTLTPVLRSDGDWGLSAKVPNVSEANPLYATGMTLWGVPSDPAHDAERCAYPNITTGTCVGTDSFGDRNAPPGATEEDYFDPHPSEAQLRPFLTNPTECSGDPVETKLHLSSWFDPAAFEIDGDPDLGDSRWNNHTASAPPVTGCEKLSFDPELSVEPTTTQPDSPSGLEFELRLPQNDDPNGLATAHLRDATVVLPEGMTVNPSSADGLKACSSAQIGLTSKSPLRFTKLEPSCPSASKIGSIEVETPLLDDPLTGDVFLAAQTDNPFDSLLAIYMVVRGPGLLVKLAGHVEADPQTGRLSTTVLNNPQVPFETLSLRLKGGPRAPLATPATCGAKTVSADLASWAGHDVEVSDSFTIDCPGMGGFAPSVSAGAVSPVGGSFSPFALRVDRDDLEQPLGGLSVELPKGLLAKLKGVVPCAGARAAAGTCGPESRIGTAIAGAGVGSSPFFTAAQHGSIYLTEGYKGGPYGMVAVVRAIAGPFDLGTVVVRQALYVDRTSAQVRVVSDPLPRILEGIPLRLRSVDVRVDRPGFTRNPTSCAEKSIKTTLTSTLGASHTAVSRFQVGDCQALPFKPRLALRLTGKRQIKTGRHPGIRATFTQGAGEAGIRQAVVRLPKALALDESNARALCEYKDGIKDEPACPAGSIVGHVRAVSPLLERPLTGNVYFVKNVRIDPDTGREIRTLPMIVAALRGEIVINLRGTSAVKGGRLISTFAAIPDAPVSRFELSITGGGNGILLVTRTRKGNINICRSRQTAVTEMDGHNGRRLDRKIGVKTPCAKKSRRASGGRKAR